MKMGTKILIGGGLLLLFAFKNKAKKGYKSYNLIGQGNTPAGSKQCYSKIGTKVYNLDGRVIFTFNFLGGGMTITGDKGDKYEIVLGDSFVNGVFGTVYKNSVII
jgi:hypothetical protein